MRTRTLLRSGNKVQRRSVVGKIQIAYYDERLGTSGITKERVRDRCRSVAKEIYVTR